MTGQPDQQGGGDFDATLERAQADGRITTHDADEVRNFAEFLAESGPPHGNPGFDPKRFGAAYKKHYPEDYATLVAARKAQS